MGPKTTLERLYAEFAEDETPDADRVEFIFHTYDGFLFFVMQREHRFRLPPDRARELLWRLHNFNLTWGLLAYGVLIIPLLSYCNYLAQKSRIRKQERVLARYAADKGSRVRQNEVRLTFGPTRMSDSGPSLLAILLRIAVLWITCAFWTVAVAIPPEHPDQDAKGCALFFLWVGQVACAYVLARYLGRRGWAWAFAALLTFTIVPAALAFMRGSRDTVPRVDDFRCDRCGAVTTGPVVAVEVCEECGWQAR